MSRDGTTAILVT